MRKSNGVVHWPEHPLATKSRGNVSLSKLEVLSHFNNEEWVIDELRPIRGLDASDMITRLSGAPYSLRQIRGGYLEYHWPGHPLAAGKNRPTVPEHHLVYWQEHGYSDEVAELLTSRKATIHHINGNKEDNKPENLELRLSGNHPGGIGESDMVKTLRTLGYKVD